jgi:hypothetical protein
MTASTASMLSIVPTILVVAATWAAPPTPDADSNQSAAVAQALEVALATQGSTGDVRLAYSNAINDAQLQLHGNVWVQQTFAETTAAAGAATSDEAAVKLLRPAIEESISILRFKIVREADLPQGFPEPTPVGEVRIKQYPTYRLAAAPAGRGENTAFWTLFTHIKTNKIAMTAPVEMTLDEEGTEQVQMAFLYGQPDWGKVGKKALVEVRDIPPMTTVSLGLRGGDEKANRQRGKKLVEEWLASTPNGSAWEPAGPWRIMGYNSPMVPDQQQYWELELPVKPR